MLTHFGGIDNDLPGGKSIDFALSVMAQPDGKLVVAGGSDSSGTLGQAGDFALARYNSDGSLDASFGSGGRVVTDFGGFDESAHAVFLQPGGKLVAAGVSVGVNCDSFALARYNQDGSLDASFGLGGKVFNDNLSFPSALVADPVGKLVAAGRRFDEDSFNGISVLVRLDPQGDLDPSFGSGGIVTGFDADQEEIFVSALVMQPDAKLVAAGFGFTGGIFLARFNPNGSLDSTFGSEGRVFTEGPFFSRALVRQPDGKLVALGLSESLIHLVRYNPDGSLDASFGSGGRVITDSGGFEPEQLVLDPNGNFIMAGPFASASVVNSTSFVLARFNLDGSLDASFGSGGRVFTTFSGRFDFLDSRVRSLALQPDGKLVAAGSSNVSGDEDFAVARYLLTDERPERPPRCGGRRATMLGTPRNDTLRGTLFGRDVILGLGGNDTIRGLGGEDILCGGTGDDVLIGGDDNDRLYGGSGNDKLFGDQGLSFVDGDDVLRGGPGRDTLVGGGESDLLFGEGGNDRLFGDRGDDTSDGGGGRDRCKDRFGRNTFNSCDRRGGGPPPEAPRDPPLTP